MPTAKTPGEKLFKRLRDLQAHAIDPANSPEARKSYQEKLDKLLADHGKTMADLDALLERAKRLKIEDASDWLGQPLPGAAGTASYTSMDLGDDAPLQLPYAALRRWTYMAEHYYVVVPLWILHTHVYDLFQYTPRLLVGSPINGCGKSLLMDLVKGMSARAIKRGSMTHASVWHLIDTQRPAPLIVDEGENLKIEGQLLSAFNDGYEMDGSREQMWGGKLRTFELFAPLAIAGVIRDPARLPLSLVTRSILINMILDSGGYVKEDQSFSKLNAQHMHFLGLAWNYIREWAVKVRAGEVILNPNPPMPLRLRVANNWRVLFAIADSFGPEWGERARDAALALERGRMLDDPGLVVLQDIRDAFASGVSSFINSHDVAAFGSKVLATTLAKHAPWDSWAGFDGKQTPHELRDGDLAAILRAFHIRPRTQWPRRRHDTGGKSCKGYDENQLKPVWKIYCGDDNTETRPTPLAKVFGLKQ